MTVCQHKQVQSLCKFPIPFYEYFFFKFLPSCFQLMTLKCLGMHTVLQSTIAEPHTHWSTPKRVAGVQVKSDTGKTFTVVKPLR